MKDYGDVIEDVSDLDIMQHALEGTTDTFTKDGKVYAIPLYMEGYGFVINKQMFYLIANFPTRFKNVVWK